MPGRKGLTAPQNTFLDTIATRFDGTHSNFVLGNAQVPPHYPIVYCSDGFCELTGYARAHIMQKGCACKFLYGPETEDELKEQIATALEEKTELQLEINLYKKSCQNPFWCLLDIVPIKNEKSEVVLFLASHKDITANKVIRTKDTLMVPGFGSESDSEDDVDDDLMKDPTRNGSSAFLGLGKSLGPDAPTNYNYGRRRSRAVLYQLSGHYKNTEKSNKKIHSKLSTNHLFPVVKPPWMEGRGPQSLLSPPTTNIQPLPEYKTSAAKKPKWVLSHYGMFKTCWDVLVLFATIYVAIMVPYNASFPDSNSLMPTDNRTLSKLPMNHVPKDRSFIVDVIIEGIFIIDILLNFRTTYVNHKGEVISSSKSIAINYVKGWFFLDLIAALPFEIFGGYFMSSNLHLLKLTRLLRLARLIQKMDRYSQYSMAILTLLMITFSLLAHWLACVWYYIGAAEQPVYSSSESDIQFPGWLNLLAQRLNLPHGGCVPTDEAYVTALYYTCTSLTTVGFGNVSANTIIEKVFSVVIMIIGALMHATIFGNVTALVARLYGARKSLYQTKWKDLKDFSILHSVPKQLKRRMQDYFQTMWSLNHGIDPLEVLMDYPEELRGDVSLHLHKEILSLPLFEAASEGCRKLVSLKIKTNFCAPDEYLIHKGDALQNIYYLFNGSMEVLHEGMVVAILGKGDLVGCDISKHLKTANSSISGSCHDVVVKSSCDVKALTYCDLKCINIPGLVEVLKLYPEFQDQFAEDIKHDLTYNLREGYDAEEDSPLTPKCGVSVILPSINEPTNEGIGDNCSMTKIVTEDLTNLSSQVRDVLDNLKTLQNGQQQQHQQQLMLIKRTSEKEVQTDFPVALLENYVVNNRKRILKLLGFTNATTNAIPSKDSNNAAGHHSLQSSWNPLPLGQASSSSHVDEATTAATTTASKENGGGQNGTSQKTVAKGSLLPRRNLYVNSATFSVDRNPKISVEKCSDNSSEDQFNPPPQSYLKRHSTGDAMELLSNLRSQPKFQEPNSSTGSLGSATGSHKKGGAAGNSATSITDF